VVIPLTMQHYPMLQRNLVYTGVTRGKRLVVIVGQKRALAMAVRGAGDKHRWSKLRERLRDEAQAQTAGPHGPADR
jgi:exodeoxyribonuclease V alpha subunit